MNNTSVMVPLPKSKKTAVIIGCLCIMVYNAMCTSGLGLLQSPILTKMNAMEYFSILTLLASLGLSLSTPIGGKLSDLYGRRDIILIGGIISVVCNVLLGLVPTVFPFLIIRFLLNAALGALIAVPYIVVREINEMKDVPKVMGMMATAYAIGSFSGSIIAGALTDIGFLFLAIIFPAVFMIAGLFLIVPNYPAGRQENIAPFDIGGTLCMMISLTAFFLSINFGGKLGWGNSYIIIGFFITIIFVFLLIRIEGKAQEPLIPLQLFQNKEYLAVVAVGGIAFYYRESINVYAPLAMQKVLETSTTVSGLLQMPRTLLTIVLPTALGAWVGKKKNRLWIAMAFSAGLVVVSIMAMGFTTASTPVLLFFIATAVTGIAESFRSVSVTTAIQKSLSPRDMGIGTALSTFANTFAMLVSSAVNGLLLDRNPDSVADGVNAIFRSTAIISAVGLLVILLVVRKQTEREEY